MVPDFSGRTDQFDPMANHLMKFIFRYGGNFRHVEGGALIYEPDNTEVPGISLELERRKLEFDRDLLEMVRDCRRNNNVINIYFDHGVSEPHVVDCMSKDDDVFVLPKFTSQPNNSQPMKNKTQSQRSLSQPTKSNPKPNVQPNLKPNEQPKPKPNVQPKPQPIVQPSTQPTTQPQIQKPTTQPQIQPFKAASSKAKSVARNKHNKEDARDKTKTRAGRTVKPSPVQEDSDSHDSYESAEDSLYKPPKIVGDDVYSESSSDSGVDGCRHDQKKKHKSTSSNRKEKVIDTDDSSYEDIEESEVSDDDSEKEVQDDVQDDAGSNGGESWKSDDMNQALESDEEL
ncbi:hypothetical protein PIB30_095092 [Stylosanthes scabra]|uniref:Uncharacterized protein n=1 Tax=Stylosanthes scabra TaxID=79078 RepID=A0ABU6QW89_9FABA|nr:hypothetical protein [Stylosanthes scabra]